LLLGNSATLTYFTNLAMTLAATAPLIGLQGFNLGLAGRSSVIVPVATTFTVKLRGLARPKMSWATAA
jgi:hypothetical protein